MSLTVLIPGLYSLPVGLGRPGRRALGVPLGGAADRTSFLLGNALVGNPPDAAALEVTLAGPTLRAECPVAAVVFGAPFEVTRNGSPLEPGVTFTLEAGDVLRVGGTATACRAYLCVAGGIERQGNGPLTAGEVLGCRPGRLGGRSLGERGVSAPCSAEKQGADAPRSPVALRTLPGPQRDWFPDDSFFARLFTVSPASNRMGVRLLGEPVPKRAGELASEPVAPGAVQVTNDGLPVVLGVDGQTIGGYPKVAHVIRADLDKLGQLRPGDVVRFTQVSEEEAIAAAAEVRQRLRRWLTRLAVSTPSVPARISTEKV
ncbi:MAG: biotin-dependent carboxyltransferase family protein [Gemmataceae bacterium]